MTDKPSGDDRPRLVIGNLSPPLRRMAPKPPPRKPKTPLFFYDRRGGATVNWRHWAAPLFLLINLLTLPLALIMRVLEAIEVFWREREAEKRHDQGPDKT